MNVPFDAMSRMSSSHVCECEVAIKQATARLLVRENVDFMLRNRSGKWWCTELLACEYEDRVGVLKDACMCFVNSELKSEILSSMYAKKQE